MSFLGQPTIAEETDLLAAKDADVSALIDAFKNFSPTWVRKDGAAMAAWLADWGSFWQRWTDARRTASVEIAASKLNPIPSTRIIAGGYNQILRALTREAGRVQRGDFQDLYTRLVAAGASVAYVTGNQPKARDVDLDMMRASDKAAHAVEQVPIVGALIGNAMQGLGLGREQADKVKPGDVTKSWLMIGGIAAGAVGIVALLRR